MNTDSTTTEPIDLHAVVRCTGRVTRSFRWQGRTYQVGDLVELYGSFLEQARAHNVVESLTTYASPAELTAALKNDRLQVGASRTEE